MKDLLKYFRSAFRFRGKNLAVVALVALAFLLGVGAKSYASETLRIFNPAVLMGKVEAENFHLTIISLLTLVNVGLIVAGVYGMMSYTVTQQAPQIGQRLTDGATTSEVLKLVLWHAMKLAVQGIVIGLGVAFLFARWVKVALFGVAATDSLTYLGVALVLGAMVFVTMFLPARRESQCYSQCDPNDAHNQFKYRVQEKEFLKSAKRLECG